MTVSKGKEVEYIVLEIWTSQFNIINHYNPCRKLGINKLKQIQGQTRGCVPGGAIESFCHAHFRLLQNVNFHHFLIFCKLW